MMMAVPAVEQAANSHACERAWDAAIQAASARLPRKAFHSNWPPTRTSNSLE